MLKWKETLSERGLLMMGSDNDNGHAIEGLSTLFSHYIPNYRNLMTSYFAKK